MEECLQKFITKMNILERGIRPQYIGAFYFRENIIQAVCGHSIFVASLINTPKDKFRIVANFHSSMINYEAEYKTPCLKTYMLSYKNDEKEDQMYFVDCHYHNGQPSFQGQGRFHKKL